MSSSLPGPHLDLNDKLSTSLNKDSPPIWFTRFSGEAMKIDFLAHASFMFTNQRGHQFMIDPYGYNKWNHCMEPHRPKLHHNNFGRVLSAVYISGYQDVCGYKFPGFIYFWLSVRYSSQTRASPELFVSASVCSGSCASGFLVIRQPRIWHPEMLRYQWKYVYYPSTWPQTDFHI